MGFGTRVYWRVVCIQLGAEDHNLQILEKRSEIMLNHKQIEVFDTTFVG